MTQDSQIGSEVTADKSVTNGFIHIPKHQVVRVMTLAPLDQIDAGTVMPCNGTSPWEARPY